MSNIEFGLATTRREDDRLLAGRGSYADDVAHAGALHLVFVRSPYASAIVRSVDASAALAHPGVVSVLSGADWVSDGFADCAAPFCFPQGDGSFAVETPRPLLVSNRVRFLGEPVALIVADGERAALDAAELVVVDYEEQAAATEVAGAAAPDAPQLWDDRPGNIAFHWRHGDMLQIEAALAASSHVTRLRSRISRVGAMPMEPRAALAYIGDDGRPVLRASHQSPHQLRDELARMFAIEKTQLRVIAGDVGGSFGMKFGPQREEMLTFWAAQRLSRAVRWTATRSEAFLCDEQARDVDATCALGLDADGKFTALRVRFDVNVGAYMAARSTAPVDNFGGISGVYTTPMTAGEVVGFFTHTQMTTAYRGAGRPDATYAIERIIDLAAAELGADPAELRRRNLIPAIAMPYRTTFLFNYDCGEFERNLDKALELSGYADFAARRKLALQRDGRLRGIGIAMPIEMAGGIGTDAAIVRAHGDGTVTLFAGSMSVGQGHDTALSTVVAQRLGLPLSSIRHVQGDTDRIENGKGNGGSSAMIMGGTVALQGVDDLIAKATRLAATELEASAQDLQFANGQFRVAGTDLVISLADLARKVEADEQPDQQQKPAMLDGTAVFTPQAPTFPNGCHVCEVEIDPQTGEVSVVGYVCVEDVGRVLNPLLVEGQIHGGVAQGIGQALFEEIRLDASGQLTTGSFMDYAMPRASDFPMLLSLNLETPTALNPLGVKGVGEPGTVGALAATMNAVCNALQAVGIMHIDMPATPVKVWHAISDAQAQRVAVGHK